MNCGVSIPLFSTMKKFISLCAIFFLSAALLSGCNKSPSLVKPTPIPVPTEKVTPTPDANFFTGDDPVWGDPNAPISMVVFSDFQCPFCATLASELLEIEKDWIATNKLKVQYRDFPLSIHKNSLSAHVASSAAERQGKYWEFHQRLYREQKSWEKLSNPSDYLLGIATDLGLDIEKFVKDYQDPAIIVEITADRDSGRLTGMEGTPSFFINGKLYEGVPPTSDLIKALQTVTP